MFATLERAIVMNTTPSSETRRRVVQVRHIAAYPGADALADALQVQENGVLVFDEELAEAVGADVVLDLRAGELAFQATLLFRVIQHIAGKTLLEFWPRRATDPDLLELWVEALRLETSAPEAAAPEALSPDELQKLFALCRRLLTSNPFMALDVHWTAQADEIVGAYRAVERTLQAYSERSDLGERASDFVERAAMRLPALWEQIGCAEGRPARAKYVTRPQISVARQMAREKLELARMRQDGAAIEAAAALVEELSPS